MVFDDLIQLVRASGQPVTSSALPGGVRFGPFTWITDLGTALVAGADVTALNEVANVQDPVLAQIGFTANNPDIGFLIWGAKLLLGGVSVQRLNPTDLAHLNSNLYVRTRFNGKDEFRSLSGAVGITALAVQELQAMAANAVNFATPEVKPTVFSHPLYVPTLKGIETFSLYNRAARTFTTPADPDTSKLMLYGVAYNTAQVSGNPALDDCGNVSLPTAEQLGMSRLIGPGTK
jgi:hypothetical protein